VPLFRADAGLPGRLRNHVPEQFFLLAAIDALDAPVEFVAVVRLAGVDRAEFTQRPGKRVVQ